MEGMSSPTTDPEPGTVLVTGDASGFAQHVAEHLVAPALPESGL